MLTLEKRKFFRILEISSIFVGVIMALYYFYPVFASPPTTAYAPGETTDPTCSPGDTNCTVYPPLTTTLTTSTAITMGASTLNFGTSTFFIDGLNNKVGIGTAAPSTSLHIVSTTEQLRLGYNSANYASFTIASNGSLTITPTGNATTTISGILSVLGNSSFGTTTITSGTSTNFNVGTLLSFTNANGTSVTSTNARFTTLNVDSCVGCLIGATTTWTFSSANVFLVTSTSLVGIGTSTPISKLTVQGAGTENPFSVVSSTAAASSMFTILTNGNVGIGTAAPTNAFVVGGASSIFRTAATVNTGSRGIAIMPGDTDAEQIIRAHGVASGLLLEAFQTATGFITSRININPLGYISLSTINTGLGAAAIERMRIVDSGNVGISTAAPSTTLHVVSTTEQLRLGYNSTNYASFTVNSSGNLVVSSTGGKFGINTSSPIASLAIQGTAGTNPFAIVSSTGSSMLTVLANGNVDIGTTASSNQLTVSGLRSDAIDTVGTTAIFKIKSSSSADLLFGSTQSSPFGQWIQSGGSSIYPLLLNPLGGLIGIGTTTPLAQLDINVGAGNLPFAVRTSTAARTQMFMIDRNGNVGINSSTPIASLSVQGTAGTNPFEIVSSTGSSMLTVLANGNVGIGTSSPAAQLSLGDVGGVRQIIFQPTTGITMGLGVASNGSALHVFSGTASSMRFLGDRVEVGSGGSFKWTNSATNPATTIDLALSRGSTKTLYVGSDATLFDGTVVTTKLGLGTTTLPALLSISLATSAPSFDISSSTGASILRVLADGRIGINSTTPIASLALQGTAGTNPFEIVSSTGSRVLAVLANDRVVIGNTSTPDAALTITRNEAAGTGRENILHLRNERTTINSDWYSSIGDGAGALSTGYFYFSAGQPSATNYEMKFAANGVPEARLGIAAPSFNSSITGLGNGPVLGWTNTGGNFNGYLTVGSTYTVPGTNGSDVRLMMGINASSTIDFRDTDNNVFATLSRRTLGFGIGIGATTPSTTLHVVSTTEQLRLGYNSTNYASFTVNSSGNLVVSSTGGKFGINSSSPIASLAIQGTPTSSIVMDIASSTGASMLRVLSNGNVGINSSTPQYTLSVSGTTTANAFIASNNGSSALPAFAFDALKNTGMFLSGTSLILSANGNGTMTLDSVGSLTANGRFITTAGAVSSAAYQFSSDADTGMYSPRANSLGFITGGVERLSVSTTGFVGINSSSPIALLSVQGTGTANPFIIASSSGINMLTMLTNGMVGINTNTPLSRLDIWGSGNTSTTLTFNTFSASGTSTFKIDDAGNASFANDGLYYEASSSVSYVNSLETGSINFDDDAGMVSWVDMVISSTPAGTPNSYTAFIGGSPMLMIYADSNGSGGIANQTISINTSTTSTYKLYIDAGVSTTAGLGVNGFIKASGYIAGTTTLDIAETYPVDPECEAAGNCPVVGDVVCSVEDTSSTFFIQSCAATSTDNLIGVVSGNPGFILGGYDVNNKIKGLYPTSFRPVALNGRVAVNVSNANGSVKAGDYLTSSGVPGVAVKALEPGRVIGVALQSMDPTLTTSTVTVVVNTGWSPGSPVIASADEESIFPDFATVVLDKFTLAVKNSLKKLGLLVKDGAATVKSLFAEKVRTNQLCVGETCINEQQLQDILSKTNTQATQAPLIIESPTTPPAPEPEPTPTTTPPVSEPEPTPTTTPPVPEDVAPTSTADSAPVADASSTPAL